MQREPRTKGPRLATWKKAVITAFVFFGTTAVIEAAPRSGALQIDRAR